MTLAAAATTPAFSAAIRAVHEAVLRLGKIAAEEAPEVYAGTASWSVGLDRRRREPEELAFLSDPAAAERGLPTAGTR